MVALFIHLQAMAGSAVNTNASSCYREMGGVSAEEDYAAAPGSGEQQTLTWRIQTDWTEWRMLMIK